MKKYKTTAYDKKNKKWDTITSEYPTKTAFIKDLRANGYRVNEKRVAEEKVYNYIMDNTNATNEDFKRIKTIKQNVIAYKNAC